MTSSPAVLEGSLLEDGMDALLVTKRIFGPLGAAEEALDDMVAVEDSRAAQVAAK